MQIEFEGESYKLDLDDIDLAQARYIKRETGLSLLKFQEGLEEVDPDCVAAAYWLMKAQSGKAVDIRKVNFPVVKYTTALIEAAARERELEEQREAENPTAEPAAPQSST